jgi:hypothetical protein
VYNDGVSEVVDMSPPKLGFGFRFSFNNIWLYYVFSVLSRMNSAQSTLCLIIILYRGIQSVDTKIFFNISEY